MDHFGTFNKCVQQGCEEEMHEAWWQSMGLKKLDSLVLIEDGGTDTIKLSGENTLRLLKIVITNTIF
jgi:hypothetical protein